MTVTEIGVKKQNKTHKQNNTEVEVEKEERPVTWKFLNLEINF